MSRKPKILTLYKKSPVLLNVFQRNIAFLMLKFNVSQKDLAKIGGFDEHTFGDFLKITTNNAHKDPLTFNGMGEFSKINEHYGLNEFDLFTEELSDSYFDTINATSKSKFLHNKLNEDYTIPVFDIKASAGYATDWFKEGKVNDYLPKNYFKIKVDFAIMVDGDSMEKQGNKYHIPNGSTLGLTELGSFERPKVGKAYVVTTRESSPVVKILTEVNNEDEEVILKSLNEDAKYKEPIKYSFSDYPVFYKIASIIYPAKILE